MCDDYPTNPEPDDAGDVLALLVAGDPAGIERLLAADAYQWTEGEIRADFPDGSSIKTHMKPDGKWFAQRYERTGWAVGEGWYEAPADLVGRVGPERPWQSRVARVADR